VHAAVPRASLYVFAEHAVHSPASGPVNPALQVHRFSVAASSVLCAPSPQLVHAASPGATLKVPAPHAVHSATPSSPEDPGLHAHSLAMAPVEAENFPVSQSVHAAGPASVLYVPISHGTQAVPPFGPVAPGLQVQFVTWMLLLGALE